MPRKRVFDLIAVIGALLLLAVLAALRSAHNVQASSVPSTYDAGPNGYAALYDMLAREGSLVQRFEMPIGDLSRRDETLVVAGKGALDDAVPSPSARSSLDRWVRSGGRLIIFDESVSLGARRALGLPPAQSIAQKNGALSDCAFKKHARGLGIAGAFGEAFTSECSGNRATVLRAGSNALGVAYRRGRGIVTLVGTPTPFDNFHLSQRDNAHAAYALLGGGTVTFDERVHGFAAGSSFWEVLPNPMRIAILIALVVAALAVAGANLPFAPPYAAQTPDERDSSAYIASLARMLERGGASHEAIARIRARCERVLTSRASGDERARMLLRELRTLEASPRPGAHDLVHAGRIFARVRKEYGC